MDRSTQFTTTTMRLKGADPDPADDTFNNENEMIFFGLYILCAAVGIISNGLSLRTLWPDKGPLSFYLSLAIGNILKLSSAIGQLSAPLALKQKWMFGVDLRQWFGFQGYVGGYASVFFTCLICVQCGLATYKRETHSKITTLTSKWVDVVTWCMCGGLALAPLLGWNAYVQEQSGTSWGLDLYKQEKPYYSYVIFVIKLYIIAAICAVVGIIVAVMKSNENRQMLGSNVTEKDLLKISAVLFTIHVVSCLPYIIRVFQYVMDFPPTFRHFVTVEFSHLLMKFGFLLQPVAYFIIGGVTGEKKTQ